jgi:hypothetical protein
VPLLVCAAAGSAKAASNKQSAKAPERGCVILRFVFMAGPRLRIESFGVALSPSGENIDFALDDRYAAKDAAFAAHSGLFDFYDLTKNAV